MNENQANDHVSQLVLTALSELSNQEFIKIALGEMGCAVFPDCDKAIFDGNFIEARWTDGVVQQYWTSQCGKGYPLYFGVRFSQKLQEMSLKATYDDCDELAKLMENAEWVQTTARIIREDIINDLSSSVDGIVDAWLMHDEVADQADYVR